MVKRSSEIAFGMMSPSFIKRAKKNLFPRRRKRVVKGALLSSKEKNYIDTAAASYAADTTGTVTLLNGVAEGDENTQRNGRKVKMLSCQINAAATTAAGNPTPQKVRFLLVWDNAPNGVIATVAQILTAANAESFPLVDNEDRFTILRDIKCVLGPNVTTASAAYVDQSIVAIDFYKAIDSDTKFSGTTNGIASIQNGALYGVTVGTLAAGATAANISYAARVRFQDI